MFKRDAAVHWKVTTSCTGARRLSSHVAVLQASLENVSTSTNFLPVAL